MTLQTPTPDQRRLILHIGMPKTGSTAIQRALATHRLNPSFAYVRLPGSVDGNDLFSVFSQNPQTYHLHRKLGNGPSRIRDFNEGIRAYLREFFRTSTAGTLIVSAESLVSLTEQEVLSLKEYLSAFFADITVAGYVRTPRGAMESGFQQSVQGKDEPLAIAGFYPAYRWKFEKFDKAFGRDNVLLWKFDPAAFPGSDVVTDFCSRLAIPLQGYKSAAAQRDNESLSLPALQALYAYRQFFSYGAGTEAIAWNDRIVTLLRTLGGAKLRFSAAALEPVLAAHADDMAWIEARIGASLADDIIAGADAVTCEADLLNVGADTLAKLRVLAREPADAPADAVDAARIAAVLVERLRQRLVDEQREQAATVARFQALIRAAKAADPAAFRDMLDIRAATLLQGAFAHIVQTLAASGTGEVVVDGLGTFHLTGPAPAGENDTPREICFTAHAAEPAGAGTGTPAIRREPRTP